jgi:hypothetical protein
LSNEINRNRWTGADISERIEIANSIPLTPNANGDYELSWHLSVPRQDVPSSIRVTDLPQTTEIMLDACAYVEEERPAQNYGTNNVFQMGRVYEEPHSRVYALLGHGAISRPAIIESAVLRVNMLPLGSDFPDPHAIGIHLIEAAWAESTVTWNNMPGHTVFPYGQFTVSADGTYETDVTAAYNAQGDITGIFGFLLKSGTDQEADNVRYFSSDTAAPELRPRLIVTSAGIDYEEVPWNVEPGPDQFAVHYPSGRMRFNAANAGEIWYFRFWDTGPLAPVAGGEVPLRVNVWTGADLSVLKTGSFLVPASPNYRDRDYQMELEEIPRADAPSSISFSDGGTPLTEVGREVEPGPGEFAVNYLRGYVRFNAAEAGKSLDYQYYGKGTPKRISGAGYSNLREDIWTGEDLSEYRGGAFTVPGEPNYEGVYEQHLSEIPREDVPTSMTVTVNGQELAQVPASVSPGIGQCAVQWTTGHVRFHESYAGQPGEIYYYGKGTPIR